MYYLSNFNSNLGQEQKRDKYRKAKLILKDSGKEAIKQAGISSLIGTALATPTLLKIAKLKNNPKVTTEDSLGRKVKEYSKESLQEMGDLRRGLRKKLTRNALITGGIFGGLSLASNIRLATSEKARQRQRNKASMQYYKKVANPIMTVQQAGNKYNKKISRLNQYGDY